MPIRYPKKRRLRTLMMKMSNIIKEIIKERKWGKDQGRDYSKEKKYNDTPKARKYRAELNKYNRDKKTYGNGDGKDASHKGGKISGFEKSSTNKGRREKSRKKGYNKKR